MIAILTNGRLLKPDRLSDVSFRPDLICIAEGDFLYDWRERKGRMVLHVCDCDAVLTEFEGTIVRSKHVRPVRVLAGPVAPLP